MHWKISRISQHRCRLNELKLNFRAVAFGGARVQAHVELLRLPVDPAEKTPDNLVRVVPDDGQSLTARKAAGNIMVDTFSVDSRKRSILPNAAFKLDWPTERSSWPPLLLGEPLSERGSPAPLLGAGEGPLNRSGSKPSFGSWLLLRML